MLTIISSHFKRFTTLNPYQILVLSFASVILIGAFLFMLPISAKNGVGLSFVNALFMSTSAVCVTGLSVVDTGRYFSTFGQIILAILIQIGGLGVMTLTMTLAILAGKHIRLKNRLLMQESLNLLTFSGVVRLVISIIKTTFAFEFIGGTLMGIRLCYDYGWYGFYLGYWHAVSAFCNAGFDIFGGTTIYRYLTSPIICLTICFLIIFGGLGFSVLSELGMFLRKEEKWAFMSLHTKVVLRTTLVLLLLGVVAIFFLEYYNFATIGALTFWQKLLASFYLSVTPRTAGFTLMNIGQLGHATLFFIIILMFIGASPGSTGGGIKTTTFTVIFASIMSIIRGNKDVVVFNRRLETDIILKSLTIFFVSMAVVVGATMYISIREHFAFIRILFEVVSAFATVGLSTGITSMLSSSSKLVLIIIMLIGRVGVMTFALSLSMKHKKDNVHLPPGKISIG